MPLSKIVANSIADDTITSDQIADTSVHGRRNIVINGGIQISQRATSVTGIGGADGYFTADRWKVFQASLDGRVTQSQASVTDLAGFPNSLKHEVTTADTSISAGEAFQLSQVFEGQDLQSFKKGYSDAEEFAYSFYVKGTAKTNCVEMYDGANTRHVAQTFSVTSSWNRVELTFPADTTGKFDDDNALSLYIIIWLHAGSNFTSGTLPATWASATNANRAVGAGSLFSATSNTFEITGAQLEVGGKASPFEHRSFGEELSLCQRYFFREGYIGEALRYVTVGPSPNQLWYFQALPVQMRADPTDTIYADNSQANSGKCRRDDNTLVSISGSYTSQDTIGFLITNSTTNNLYFHDFDVDAEL